MSSRTEPHKSHDLLRSACLVLPGPLQRLCVCLLPEPLTQFNNCVSSPCCNSASYDWFNLCSYFPHIRYMLTCTVGCGVLMAFAFWENGRILHRSKTTIDTDNTDSLGLPGTSFIEFHRSQFGYGLRHPKTKTSFLKWRTMQVHAALMGNMRTHPQCPFRSRDRLCCVR